MDKKTIIKNYIIAFVITVLIFATAFFLSSYINNKKVESLQKIQDNISLDILSTETQFSLLQELACKDVGNSLLSEELNTFAEKIEYSEKNGIGSSDEVRELKKYYSLLEIKDYLLMQQISERCGKKAYSIIYVYTTADNCSECAKQGYVLTALREKYPELRVYSFDWSTDLSAVKALLRIFDIKDTKLPAIIVADETFTGFQSIEDIEKKLPSLVREHKKLEEQKAKEAAATASTEVK